MADFINKFKQYYQQGDALKRLILVNVICFVAIGFIGVIGQLFRLSIANIGNYFALLSIPKELLLQPWTLVTYMFMHQDIWHILFNMLWLYWFGNLFLQLYTQKQLVALYIYGGLLGAAVYLLSYNLFPYFDGKIGSMVGASASVLAIVAATAFRIPNHSVRLLLLGEVKLIYIAGFSILIDLLSITSENAGGHFAHLGGALMGYLFFASLNKGIDLTKPFNNAIDKLISLSRPKPKMKVKYRRAESDMEFRERKNNESQKVDAILDKLKKSGYGSLNAEEKKQLFDASKK